MRKLLRLKRLARANQPGNSRERRAEGAHLAPGIARLASQGNGGAASRLASLLRAPGTGHGVAFGPPHGMAALIAVAHKPFHPAMPYPLTWPTNPSTGSR